MKMASALPHCFSGLRIFLAIPALLALAAFSSGNFLLAAQKMKPEELVAKHLESIGSTEAPKWITSRDFSGTCVLTMLVGGSGQLSGTVRMASSGRMNLLDMQFNMIDYPHERIAFDGKEVTLGQLKPGLRSYMANFLRTQDMLIKEGLLGGSISTAWPLYDVKGRKAKLNYEGIRQIDGRDLHELRYQPNRQGTDVRVLLYFDPENFQHVKSIYRMTISAGMETTPEKSARLSETRYQIVEDFSNFAREKDVTLPHKHRIQLTIDSQSGTVLMYWESNLNHFIFNNNISREDFRVDKN